MKIIMSEIVDALAGVWIAFKRLVGSKKFWIFIGVEYFLYHMAMNLHGSYDSWAMYSLGNAGLLGVGLQNDKYIAAGGSNGNDPKV